MRISSRSRLPIPGHWTRSKWRPFLYADMYVRCDHTEHATVIYFQVFYSRREPPPPPPSRTAEAHGAVAFGVYRVVKRDHPCDDRERIQGGFVEGPGHWFSIGQSRADRQYNGILRIEAAYAPSFCHRISVWYDVRPDDSRSCSGSHRCYINERIK